MNSVIITGNSNIFRKFLCLIFLICSRLINFAFSYYGHNQGFRQYPMQLADVNAVVRDRLIWQSMLKDDWVFI